ncbi:hypothetical protein I79_004108 [Cricetulus griseus]|uniref:Uncharacterized protein n=1 Tax=Cricetulus griseus TaxID=10029 RepID=G3H1S6_CRIGR|nr:hypothetical protein I79_004108 [Cricetulus griseus]
MACACSDSSGYVSNPRGGADLLHTGEDSPGYRTRLESLVSHGDEKADVHSGQNTCSEQPNYQRRMAAVTSTWPTDCTLKRSLEN